MAGNNFTPIDALIKKYQQSYSAATGSLTKEAEPIPGPIDSFEIRDVVEHEPAPEVEPFVKPKPETIKLPPDLKLLGLQPVSNTQFPAYKNVKTLITDDKIIAGLHQPVTSSTRWLATLALYILQQAHLTLKVVGGRVVRVIKR